MAFICSCLDDPQPAYVPSKIERLNHIFFQAFIINFSLIIASYISGYTLYQPFIIGIVGTIPIMIFIWIIILVSNYTYGLNWWRQTYALSFIMTGLWMNLFNCIIVILYSHKKENLTKEEKILSIILSSSIAILLIVIECYLVIGRKKYAILKYYKMGYSSTSKDPALRNYIQNIYSPLETEMFFIQLLLFLNIRIRIFQGMIHIGPNYNRFSHITSQFRKLINNKPINCPI